MSKDKITVHYNSRQYSPGQWEVWQSSRPIAHSTVLQLVLDKYPTATVIGAHEHNFNQSKNENAR